MIYTKQYFRLFETRLRLLVRRLLLKNRIFEESVNIRKCRIIFKILKIQIINLSLIQIGKCSSFQNTKFIIFM